MSAWLDHKYINLVSPRLRNFKWANQNTARCSCPICGDSAKNKHKARFYFVQKDNKFYTYCHNCNASLSFDYFLKGFDSILHQEYIKENILEKISPDKPQEDTKFNFEKPKFLTKESPLKNLKRISQLDHNHFAKKYVEKRKIPPNQHFKLFFTPKFNSWVNTLIPNKLPESYDEPRLVIPFIDKDNNVFAFQGRALGPSNQRYITIFLDENKPKIFGLETVDLSKKHYVVEGPIDSLFLPNCIAMAGSDVDFGVLNEHSVIVYDNQPRNADLVKNMEKIIEKNISIVIWPNDIKGKDINDMVLNGMTTHDIVSVIEKNTYTYLHAKLKLNSWKKV